MQSAFGGGVDVHTYAAKNDDATWLEAKLPSIKGIMMWLVLYGNYITVATALTVTMIWHGRIRNPNLDSWVVTAMAWLSEGVACLASSSTLPKYFG